MAIAVFRLCCAVQAATMVSRATLTAAKPRNLRLLAKGPLKCADLPYRTASPEMRLFSFGGGVVGTGYGCKLLRLSRSSEVRRCLVSARCDSSLRPWSLVILLSGVLSLNIKIASGE